MLREILRAFGADTILSIAALEQKFGVQEPLLIQMLGELVRLGYLEEDANCSAGCEVCGNKTACGSNIPQRMWYLTEKGHKFIN